MANLNPASSVKNARDTAHKALAAAGSFAGLYVGVLVADLSDAVDWVYQLLVLGGGAIGTALVYVTRNRRKR